ncbi:aminoglycoside phosphotransferase [Streptomyces sp. NPDC001315]|uniref:aminoglycoside phosphotransferase n=1 Tax=Streptomyces sp. NPDC001315 TaxID=3364562 RepID=UPI00369EA9F1
MITTRDDPRVELARKALGNVRVLPDHALPPRLLRLTDGRGCLYFAKQHDNRERYLREVQAYEAWGHHLVGHAPRLLGRHDSTRTLLLTAVPGVPVDILAAGSHEEERAHHEAGRMVGMLHRATAGPRSGAIGAVLAQRLQNWIDRAGSATLISAEEHRRLNSYANVLARTRMDSAVCHLDYQPRNWLLGDSFGICDFEHMRRDARIRDFARLEFRHWQAAPQLRAAFFAGYGTPLNETEQRLLESFGAIEAATALVRGHEQDDRHLITRGRSVLARLT